MGGLLAGLWTASGLCGAAPTAMLACRDTILLLLALLGRVLPSRPMVLPLRPFLDVTARPASSCDLLRPWGFTR
jgi:hypothetical protein